MQEPLFVEPVSTPTKPFDALRVAAAAPAPLTLEITPGTEPLVIMNFEPRLPSPTSTAERMRLVRAGRAATNLDEEGWHAVSRGVTQVSTATAMVRGELLLAEVAESATLRSLPSHVYLSEIFPLIQPRTAASPDPVDQPLVKGLLDADGNPMAAVSMTFHDEAHLKAYMRQTILETRREGRHYEESILSRRVSRPVLLHVARLDFSDGSGPIWVLVVRDGISRVVSSWAARLGSDATGEDIAEVIAQQLLASKPPRAGKEVDATQDHARGREQGALATRAAFAAGTAAGAPNESAIRLGQTFTLPAHICVGVEPGGSSPLPASEVFDDAERSVVSSIHIDFKGWDEAAGQAEVIDRALHRAAHRGLIASDVVELATGALRPEATPTVFGDPEIPPTPLWRAVCLVAALTSPSAVAAIKAEMRSLLGIRRITSKRLVGHLGPVVDRPWRVAKAKWLPTARRAWSQNGPVPAHMLATHWRPIPTSDFTTLVPLALADDQNARFTLEAAGGIALVADKLISSNVGSALAEGRVPFRADPAEIVSGLGSSETGLWLLARAANAFDADRTAINSFTETDLAHGEGQGSYTVPRLDPKDASSFKLDNAGAQEPITEGEIVRISNPERAEESERSRRKQHQTPPSESPAARATRLRSKLGSLLAEADDTLDVLLALRPQTSTPPLGTQETWEGLTHLLMKLQAGVFSNQPPTGPAPDPYVIEEDEGAAVEDTYAEDIYGDDVATA